MSDTTLNAFVASGTAAERAAFTPTPPTPSSGPDPGYFWFETDTGLTYSWDGAVWVLTGGSPNAVTAAGTLTANQIVLGAGTKTTAALGSLGTTTTLLHGNAAGAPTFGAVTLTTDVTGVLPVANGGTGSASGASVLSTQVTVPVANFRALPTTRYELIAAPGANRLIWPIQILMMTSAGGAAFTNINTTQSFVIATYAGSLYGSSYLANDSTNTPALTDITAFLGTPGDVAPLLWPFDDDRGSANAWGNMPYPDALASLVNQPLQLLGDNGGSGNWTLGGNVIVDILYRVITTP